MPANLDDYRLVHGDVNPTNFHVNQDKNTLYGFDDCDLNSFINDIAVAMPLYSSIFKEPDWKQRLHQFDCWFICGYREENQLDKTWMHLLPTCMRLQNLTTQVAMHQSNVPGSQYHSFYELVLKAYCAGHLLFHYDFWNECNFLYYVHQGREKNHLDNRMKNLILVLNSGCILKINGNKI